jgi:hypothetical protein
MYTYTYVYVYTYICIYLGVIGARENLASNPPLGLPK